MDVERSRTDYETFLRDLEEDKEMRAEVNLYRHPAAFAAAAAQPAGGGRPAAAKESLAAGASDDEDNISEAEVGLEELLDDLTLNQNETFDDRDELAQPAAFVPPGTGAFHFT